MTEEGKAKSASATWKNEWERFEIIELAKSTMTGIWGIYFRAIMAEERKEHPDIEKLKRLEKEEERLYAEQQQISFNDKEALQRYIKKYSPIIKAHFEKFKKNKDDESERRGCAQDAQEMKNKKILILD